MSARGVFETVKRVPDPHFGTAVEFTLALRGFEAIGGTDLTIPPPALVAQAIPYSAAATMIAATAYSDCFHGVPASVAS